MNSIQTLLSSIVGITESTLMANIRRLAIAAAWLALCAILFGGADDVRRPNILLIVSDDLGFSDLGCYGSEIETPHLDRLASRGLRLTQFYSTGRCCPSRATILTGLYSHRVGLGHMTQDLGLPGYRGRISPEVPTIAERLAAAGYQSFLSGKWHLGTEDPTERGFEQFYGTLVSAQTYWDADHYIQLPNDAARPADQAEFYGTDALADRAIDFVTLAEQTPEKPWFLYLAFNAPHFPLQAPRENIERYAEEYERGWDELRRQRLARIKQLGILPADTQLTSRSRYYDWGQTVGIDNPAWDSLSKPRQQDLARRMAIYAAMIDRMDDNIGRVLDELVRRETLAETLIIFTSDNGACAEWNPYGFDGKSGPKQSLHFSEQLERMGSPGTYHSVGSGWANVSNTPWRLYKHFNHEGGIAVPCIIHWPAFSSTTSVMGSIDSIPAHLIDLVPTILAAAGVDPRNDDDSGMPGLSLLPLLRGTTLAHRRLFFEHEGHRAVREGSWKLVALRGREWELYDMRKDRTEMHDLAAAQRAVVNRLSASWDEWAKQNQVIPLPTDYGVEYIQPVAN